MKRDNTLALRKLLRGNCAPFVFYLFGSFRNEATGGDQANSKRALFQLCKSTGPPGSVLSVGPPDGRFVLGTPKEGVQYTGIAAGSGITPIWAIIKEILNNTKTSSFYLIYSNKSTEDEMFTNEINDLILLYPKRFSVFRTYSQKEVKGHAYGRIGSALLDRYFEEIGFSSERFFLCGPEGMIHMASDYLKERESLVLLCILNSSQAALRKMLSLLI